MSNFSFSHSVFQRLVFQGHQQVSLCGNGLNNRPFKNVGKGENVGNQDFLLFPQCFLFYPYHNNFSFSATFTLLSANAFNLDLTKILLFGKELSMYLLNFQKRFTFKDGGLRVNLTSIFSFSHNVFYLSHNIFQFFGHIYF